MPARIEKKSKNSYLLTVNIGYDEHGKQLFKRKTVKASNDREARKEYDIFAAEVRQGRVAFTGKYKLTDFARDWFQNYCLKALAPKTQRSYKNHLERRILPALGHMDIKNIMPQHIMKFIDDLRETGSRYDNREGKVSDETVRYCFRVLSSMFHNAVQWQIIATNPCERVKPPSVSHKKIKIIDEVSVKKMFSSLKAEPLKYQTIVFVAVDTGLRLGELVGLTWSDIDMEKGILHITKSNQAMRGKGIFTKSTKTETSV